MDLVENNWIALALAGSAMLHLLISGVRIFDGERYTQVGPLVPVRSFWLWLAITLTFAACVGVATFFVASARAG